MRSTFFVLAAALPFLVGASPAPIPAAGRNVIPLTRRTTLLNSDGSVNVQSLRDQVSRTVGKLQKGFKAFERNTGAHHPGYNPNSTLAKRANGKLSLVDVQENLWYGTISVGTPPKQYTVDFDTGSSDLFLPGPNCKSSCSGHAIYNPSTSSTSIDLKRTFSLAYGDGSTVSGEQFSDTVRIAGLNATKQAVGAAKQYSSGFAKSQFPADGLLGMGFQQISDFNQPPVFQTFVAEGQTDESVFGFRLTSGYSELTLGTSNKNLYTGAIAYTPITTEGYWQVTTEAISVAGKKLFSNVDSIIDTGTTLIVGTPAQVKTFYKSIPGSKEAINTIGSGFYTFPCATKSFPSISFTYGGKAFPISFETFNLGALSAGGSECVGGITGEDIGTDFWIVGDVFLQNVYALFDYGNKRVGFAFPA